MVTNFKNILIFDMQLKTNKKLFHQFIFQDDANKYLKLNFRRDPRKCLLVGT